MGGQESRAQSSHKAEEERMTENELLDKPWRELIGWSNTNRNSMKREVAELKPELHEPVDVKYFNILLTGEVNTGKSSIVNSVYSVYREGIMNKAEAGSSPCVVTRHFRIYKINEKPSSEPFAWRICDTMGLQKAGVNAGHILAAVDGKIPDNYEFTESVLYPDSPGLIPHPSLADQAHCVAIVVAAERYMHMPQRIWEQLRLVRERLLSREIPTFVLLSKVDILCPHVKRNAANVYRSVIVRDACEEVSRKLELPLEHIFPIKNYHEEIELNDANDILLLFALRQMLQTAQKYVKEKLAVHNERELLDTPVREVQGWDKDVRQEIKTQVSNMGPPNQMGVQYINILLAGQIGSGKSSFCNSLFSLFRGEIVAKAQVGLAARSLTTKFRMYKIREPSRSASFSWRICDTMGLMPVDGGIDADHILQAVDGKLPDNYEFDNSGGTIQESQDLNLHPTLADQAHCVAIVVDAMKCSHMDEEMWKKIKTLREGLISRQVPFCILLSKIDMLCPHVVRDIKNVYRSPFVYDVMTKVSMKLMGLPKMQIFPIKNYEAEQDVVAANDILLLYAVRKMLVDAKVYLETKEEEN